ncbi:MAG: hypothetical protein JW910_22690 [Anaerolineae bacterium]|nr:hypothetical protein [Anaerolineae bacterium]
MIRRIHVVSILSLLVVLVLGSTSLPTPAAKAQGSVSPELFYAEIYTDPETGQLGRTVYFSDRGNKQLLSHWVPGDPNRGGGTNISFAIDVAQGAANGGLSAGDTSAAIRRAMNTWQSVNCSNIPLTDFGDQGDLGYVQWLLGFGGTPYWVADVTFGGWLPGSFFDAIEAGGSQYILGVTFTLIWVDDVTGVPTDMDSNGKNDVAFREIYFNNNFAWAIGNHYDVETIALHEAGHGLSQGHFGEAFRTGNGKLQFNPRALMNAAYSGIQTTVSATDNGGHCSIWGSWPNR